MLHTATAADDYDDDNDDSDNDDDGDVVYNSTLPVHDVDEAPEDLDAFFVHPLMAATRASGDGDAMALLHEYRNLPLLDVNLSANSKYAPSRSIRQYGSQTFLTLSSYARMSFLHWKTDSKDAF